MAKKPEPPPELLNKLYRSKEPLVADLQGPGPFQLPLLTNTEFRPHISVESPFTPQYLV